MEKWEMCLRDLKKLFNKYTRRYFVDLDERTISIGDLDRDVAGISHEDLAHEVRCILERYGYDSTDEKVWEGDTGWVIRL